jgi:signal transduction histidine kinase
MDVEWAADDQRQRDLRTRSDDTHAVLPVDRQHDIRAAATTIVWLASALGSNNQSEQDRARSLDGIVACAQTITALTADDRRRPRLEAAVALDELVRAAAERVRLTFPVRVTVTIDAVPAIVWAPAIDIVRVLDNLFANACQAAGAGGTVHAVVAERGDRVVTEIVDSGPGIDAMPSTRGVGLSIVVTLVEQLGGTLTLERVDASGGTRARVELPRVQEVDSSEPESETPRSCAP